MQKLFFLAFSLIEILLVITILTVVIGLGWYKIYLPYLHKAYLLKDGLNLARACLIEILNYCQDHKSKNFNIHNFENCRNRKSLYGFLTFQINNNTCSPIGSLSENTTLIVKDTISKEFRIECIIEKNTGYKCIIKQTD